MRVFPRHVDSFNVPLMGPFLRQERLRGILRDLTPILGGSDVYSFLAYWKRRKDVIQFTRGTFQILATHLL